MNTKRTEKKMISKLKTFLPVLSIFLFFQIAEAATLTVMNANDAGVGS